MNIATYEVLDMKRIYWILVGKVKLLDDYEMIFGDYDREVVRQELEDTKTSGDYDYHHLKVVRVIGDTTAHINQTIIELNNKQGLK